MARIRTIKPHFFRSYDVASLSYRARLTWIGLWTYVDDEGRGRDDARIIKGELWALEDDVTWQDVQRDLTELSVSAHVTRYRENGRDYLAIPTWNEHQVISRPTTSKFPAPTPMNIREVGPITEHSVSAHGVNSAGKGTGNREQGSGTGNREQEPSLTATTRSFDTAWEHWPKKVERKAALAKYLTATKRHPDLEAAVIQFGDAYTATTETQFVPALGVWLNGDRWTDDLPQPRSNSTPSRTEQNLTVVQRYAEKQRLKEMAAIEQ